MCRALIHVARVPRLIQKRMEAEEEEEEVVGIRPPPLHPPPVQSAYLLTSRNLCD